MARLLTKDEIKRLENLGRVCRGDIIKMTTVANSGHPGGSMSSIDIFLSVYDFAEKDPKNPTIPNAIGLL